MLNCKVRITHLRLLQLTVQSDIKQAERNCPGNFESFKMRFQFQDLKESAALFQ